MANTFSLQPLRHLAQQRNDAATRKLGKLNQQHRSEQDKLNMLQQFRKDYQIKFQEAARNGMAPNDLRNFQEFINRLDEAINQQLKTIEQAQRSVQSGRSELSEAQRRMKSFDTLAQRHVEAERKLETKAEQKIQDEHTGRFVAHKRAEKGNES
jgi:flagellar FliJ protein